ncbi:MAG: trypsin-like peptidase domain-containing protein [Cyanobacteria bacterium SID2]|nr:trypsin-like peptidase domain-containing protein [Cyanobacteria bacterium SID2]MBP0002178.1 trypsin-like peptidase domain-containing protein [Cyanobacteria bacterium SBC]
MGILGGWTISSLHLRSKTRPRQHRRPNFLLVTFAAISFAVPLSAAQALTEEEVDAVASVTTVVIGQGLQKGDIEAQREWNPGSGVIVARDGNTYYVLTALHVVRTRETVYGIRTSDGEVHFVDDVNTQDNIIPLGEEVGEFGETIGGYDLATISFESDRDYPVAVIGNAQNLQPGDPIYISGWPNPDDASARRMRETVSGTLTAIRSPSEDGGYSLLYSNETQRGMSGGPVFDRNGELIGIHGRGRGREDIYCLDPQLSLENSCGMQSVHFVMQIQRRGLNLAFEMPPVDPEVIAAGLENIERADTIEDIYAAFTFDLKSLLRDGPSGGCGSLLLGDPCERL